MASTNSKRKLVQQTPTSSSVKKVKNEDCVVVTPYPEFKHPTEQETRVAVQLLANLHGLPTKGEFTNSVLDSLVRTMLSQNTTDKNSRVAFASLKKTFPTWKRVYEAQPAAIEESIRHGGLAQKKTENILALLSSILNEYPQHCVGGEPSLDFMRALPTEEVKAKLLRYKGIGPKTVSCVLLFNMHREEFPVDTHVFHIAKKLRWIPASSSAETAYAHLNARVPGELKFPLHIGLVEHGKRCKLCSKGALQLPSEGDCPFVGNWADTPLAFSSSDSPKMLQHLDLQSGYCCVTYSGKQQQSNDTNAAESKEEEDDD